MTEDSAMTILITGTNGFIGSHVASYFKSHGFVVIGLGRSAQPTDETIVNQYVQCDIGTDLIKNTTNGIFANRRSYSSCSGYA